MGQRIAALRARRGLKQKELADLAGISVSFLSDIENDKRTISADALLRLADALAASLDYIVRGGHSVTEEKPLAIPPRLAAVASVRGWSYAVTADLLRAQSIVLARRTPGGDPSKRLSEMSSDDWVNLHKTLFEDD